MASRGAAHVRVPHRARTGARRCALPALVRALAATLAFLAGSLASVPSGAQEPPGASMPTVDAFDRALEFAENAYLYGDFGDVIRVLSPVLVPVAAPAEPARIQRAWLLVGVSSRLEGDVPMADLAFLRVLEVDPTYQLDPLLYPAAVIEAFEQVRDENEDYLSQLVPEEEEAMTTVYVEREVRSQPRVVSLLPFGIGFFAADRDVGGLSYLMSQLATGSTMVGLYLANESARNEDGSFDAPTRARRRGRAQQAMAGTFVALIFANVMHGALLHEQIEQVEYRTLPALPDELQRGGPAPTSRLQDGRRWAIGFTPIFAFE